MTDTGILVAEDDPKVVVFIVDQLEGLGYRVTVARNGVEALEKAKETQPKLIVLDVMMPEMDGYEACHQLRSSPETRNIPILMLTAKGQLQDKVKGLEIGADDYLPKPYDKAEFEARVKALLRRPYSPPFVATARGCVLSLSCLSERRIGIRVEGDTTFRGVSKGMLDIDPNVLARQADSVLRLDWRFHAKQLGKQVYNNIFVAHPEILSSYCEALGAVKEEGRLSLCFETPRDLLRVPFEFLFDEIRAAGDYYVLKHPLFRSITGVRVWQPPVSPSFLNDLWIKGESLRILLIASNTRPAIPNVDREVLTLGNSLKRLFDNRGISTRVKTIPTELATYETVREELQRCRYHIVHYAGHGAYDRESPERSYLSFWEKRNRQGVVRRMPIYELQVLLRGGHLRFAYLSCCSSTATGEPAKLLDDDFLGIADGIIQAGVPAVLGFRWAVSDSGARTLALAFYESLARHGRIDIAVLNARCEAAAQNRDDRTWLSPVLIFQA